MVKGWAVIDRNKINLRTVSDTEQAAMVNGLGVICNFFVHDGYTFDEIKAAFQNHGKHKRGLSTVEVDVTEAIR